MIISGNSLASALNVLILYRRFGLYIILKRKLLWILALYKAVALALMPNEWRYYGIEKANLVKNIQKIS